MRTPTANRWRSTRSAAATDTPVWPCLIPSHRNRLRPVGSFSDDATFLRGTTLRTRVAAFGSLVVLCVIAALLWTNVRRPQPKANPAPGIVVDHRVRPGEQLLAHQQLRERAVAAWVLAGMEPSEADSLGNCMSGFLDAMASSDMSLMESHAAARGATIAPSRAAAIASGMRGGGLINIAPDEWERLDAREQLRLAWAQIEERGIAWESWNPDSVEVRVNDYLLPPSDLPHLHGWTTVFDPPEFHELATGVREGTRPSAWVRFALKMAGSDPMYITILFGQDRHGRWHPLNIQSVGADRTPRLLF